MLAKQTQIMIMMFEKSESSVLPSFVRSLWSILVLFGIAMKLSGLLEEATCH